MSFSPLIEQLINALRCLPGVGPKSAQRMVFHLLERGRDQALQLSQTLQDAMEHVGHCDSCNTFSENPHCKICSNAKRNQELLCIIETPADMLAIEQTHTFHGLYFVLMGHLSPLDGIGPNDLAIDKLLQYLQQRSFQEIILATNPTIEGEATAHYLAEQIKPLGIKTSRIAHGVPVGSELEFVDGGTLMRAFDGRETVS